MQHAEPQFALVEIQGGYIVERFAPERHITQHGWTPPSVTLFTEPKEVEHLRDQILN